MTHIYKWKSEQMLNCIIKQKIKVYLAAFTKNLIHKYISLDQKKKINTQSQ